MAKFSHTEIVPATQCILGECLSLTRGLFQCGKKVKLVRYTEIAVSFQTVTFLSQPILLSVVEISILLIDNPQAIIYLYFGTVDR